MVYRSSHMTGWAKRYIEDGFDQFATPVYEVLDGAKNKLSSYGDDSANSRRNSCGCGAKFGAGMGFGFSLGMIDKGDIDAAVSFAIAGVAMLVLEWAVKEARKYHR